jgi:hypothetical protein
MARRGLKGFLDDHPLPSLFGLGVSVGAALLSLFFTTSVSACPECEEERCVPFTGVCGCVRRIGCTISVPVGTPRGSPVPVSPIPLPEPIQKEVDKLGEGASHIENLGGDIVKTFQKAGGDTVRTLQKAGGDAFATIHKAGDDSFKTMYKARGDAAATYVKAWRDVGEGAKQSFDDAVDAGKAVANYVWNQANAPIDAARNAEKRLRDGKVVDAMWGAATEPLKSSEENFFQATQESEWLDKAAGSAAAVYGGPGGAAAYAAWSTYRRTGNADMALLAGVGAGVTHQMGGSIAQMPTGTTGEIIKKAAMAGAAGGISVAAAGGDEQAIKDGFLKSAGAVLVQGGSDKLKAYSPEAGDAYETVQCISARDVDCLSKTTWARDAGGKILYDRNGKPRIDPRRLDPSQYVGKWSGLDPQSPEGKKNEFIAQISKLPEMEAIPLLKNKWVLTWNLGEKQDIPYKAPTVVLTYVGKDAPFTSKVSYGDAASLETLNLFSDITVWYYKKPADEDRIVDALEKQYIDYETLDYVGPRHERALSNALICGPDTPVEPLKRVALTLIGAGVDIKYIGTKHKMKPRKIMILNRLEHGYTMNNPNLTRNQITELSECPSALRNQ